MTAKQYQKLRIMRIRAAHAIAVANKTPVPTLKPSGRGIKFEVLHEKEENSSVPMFRDRKKRTGSRRAVKERADKAREAKRLINRELVTTAQRKLRRAFGSNWFFLLDALVCLGISRHKWMDRVRPFLKLEERKAVRCGKLQTQYRRMK